MTTTLSKLEEEGSSMCMQQAKENESGFKAWLQVAGVFAVWINTFGLVNAYGQFQSIYEKTINESPSNIAWIGSIQSFILLGSGFVTGALFDVGYFRVMLIVGNILIILGLMLTSIAKEYWQIVLTQGIVMGLGMGLIFIPGLAILPQYFSKRLQFANGVATIGSGIGGVLYPIVLRRLEKDIGLPWAIRVLGFFALLFAAISVLSLRNKNEPKAARRLIPSGTLQDAPILIYTVGLFVILVALYVPVVYVTSYSLEKHIASSEMSFYLVPILQAANVGGRLLAFFADYIGPINLTIPALLAAAILAFCWNAVRSLAGILVFCILYGVCFGVVQGLGPGCVASLTPGGKDLPSRLGLSFGVASFGLLIGTPVAGAILSSGSSFLGVQIFVGCLLLVAMLLYLISRWKTGGGWLVKL